MEDAALSIDDMQHPDSSETERRQIARTPLPWAAGLRRMVRRLVFAAVFFTGFAALLVYIGQGRQFDLPDWARASIAERIEPQLGGLQIEFGKIQLVLNQGWRPRIGVRDLALLYSDGRPAAFLADAQASLSMRALLLGQLRLKTLYLAGLSASLQRAEGALALTLAEGADVWRQAQNLPQIIEYWDTYLTQPELAMLTSVEVEGVTLRYEDLRMARAWTFDGGYIRLDRSGADVALSTGFSVLGGNANVGTVEARYQSKIGDTAAEFGIGFTDLASQDIAVQSPALGWLEVLRAPISGSVRGRLDSEGGLEPVAASLEIGSGVLQPTDTTRPVAFDGASSYFTYFPNRQLLQFDGLSVSTGWGSGQMEGVAQLGSIQNGQLDDLVGQLQFSDLTLNPFNMYDSFQDFAGVTADFKLELHPFRLTLGEATVSQGDTTAHLKGAVWTDENGWVYALDGNADVVTVDQVKSLWPAAAPPKPRKWVRENMMAGVGRDVQVSLRSRPKQKPFLSLSLGFENARLRFFKTMPLLENASGQFSLYGNRLVASADAGTVKGDTGGVVDVAGTSFIIPDTTVKGGGPGIVRMNARGPVTAAFSLLNREPLQVMDKADLPVDLAEGQVAVNGTLSLPLRDKVPIDEITYHYRGTVTGARTDRLVSDHVLEAERLTLSGDQSHVQLVGKGRISGVAADVDWRLPLGTPGDGDHRVIGQIDLTPEAVDAFNIGLPRGSVSGRGTGEFQLLLPKEAPPQLTLASDLAGVGLSIPALGWRKGPTSTGRLQVEATLGDEPRVDQIALEAAGLNAEGQISLRTDGGLDQADFSTVRLSNWLQSRVTFTGRGAAAPALALNGGRLDLRRAPFSSHGSGGAGGGGAAGVGPITFALNELRVTDSIALNNTRGRVSLDGGVNGQFQGRLNGQTPVSGVLVPQGGGVAIRVQSNDAGGVFRSSGILRHAADGSFDMTLAPADRPGYFNGQITARNTRIQNAPALLALVNSLSLVGLVTELAGQGLLFSEVSADFELGPTHLKLIKSSAVGPSIGMSMDGVYLLDTGQLNMRGVFSPIYLVNAIGSVLTRKGEGLIGFAFTMRGDADDPRVVVNPLSGLAPGFLREIFRGEAPLAPGEKRVRRERPPTVAGGDR